ncbi:hypothetical protein [Bifidobacterium miconisargentati]|uniref:hypothetical protein n=1 Tax=Bifidobacterium miconisargentati TaxID=2834437 RepID=UPI001BDCAA08|nr:hypothetical protein [Bifidobacterium miconisargentati]MBW3089115.1 hypothetical protein [Bifidobacterium miconisargentati]
MKRAEVLGLVGSLFRPEDHDWVEPYSYSRANGLVEPVPLDVPIGEPGLVLPYSGLMLLCLTWDDSPMREARAAARRAGLSDRLIRLAGLERFPDTTWRLGLYIRPERESSGNPLYIDAAGFDRNVNEESVPGVEENILAWDRAHRRPVSDEMPVGIQPRFYVKWRDAWECANGTTVSGLGVTLDRRTMRDCQATSVPRAAYLLGRGPLDAKTRYPEALAMSELLLITTVYEYDPLTATSADELREVPAMFLPQVIDAWAAADVARYHARCEYRRVVAAATRTTRDQTRSPKCTGLFNGPPAPATRLCVSPSEAHAPRNAPRRGKLRAAPTASDLIVKAWHPTANNRS